MKRTTWMLALAGALLVSGCDRAELVLTEENDGETVSLPVGRVLVVALPGNPTTGYEWQWRSASGGDVLTLEEDTHVPADDDVVGAGGVTRFRFRARGRGIAPLRFDYRRPWSDATDRTYRVTVNVR